MAPKPVIGLLGGGQLGRMLCEAAAPLEIEIAILDAENAPAKQINQSERHVTGSYKDADKIRELAGRCSILSVETEHVDTAVLEEIESHSDVVVSPSWKTIRLIQDKYEQKAYLAREGLPVADSMAIDATGEAMRARLQEVSAAFGFPWMLKSRKDSYDGRGNLKIDSPADLDRAVAEFGGLHCYAERFVPFFCELSVLVIRSEDAEGRVRRLVPYPAVQTVHEDNVCSRVYLPPLATPPSVSKRAQEVASRVVGKLWGRGIFAVELFVTADDKILVNEIAPRPHNSGHLFTEAVPYMSQFKAQLTAILDEPLPRELEPHVASSMMINVLGGARADSHLPLIEKAKSMYGDKMAVYVHLYGKQSKPGRKIGHITVTGLEAGIHELDVFAEPLVRMANAVRQERLQARSETLRPEQHAVGTQPGLPSQQPQPLVLVTMGSDSDLPVLKAGLDVLTTFGVPWEVDITSAHRTPARMAEVASQAAGRGIKVIIAAAGGAAHLPGMVSAYTPLPVIGVPVKATHLDGVDSLLSIVQMPRGVPTATVGINNSVNAALLAIRCLGAFIPEFHDKMAAYLAQNKSAVEDKAELLREIGVKAYLEKMGKS